MKAHRSVTLGPRTETALLAPSHHSPAQVGSRRHAGVRVTLSGRALLGSLRGLGAAAIERRRQEDVDLGLVDNQEERWRPHVRLSPPLPCARAARRLLGSVLLGHYRAFLNFDRLSRV